MTQLEALHHKCLMTANTIGSEVVGSSWQLTHG